MKKIVLLGALLCLAACGREYQLPAKITDNQIKEDYQVLYSPSGRFWSDGGMVEDRILFSKHISPGSGGYSEYRAADGLMLEDFGSNFEFLYDGRLIGYNVANFKFYEVVYQDSRFLSVELSPEEVQKIFPGLEIVKLSTAQNGVLTIKKLPFETKSFLIYNDTNQDFYKYQFETPLTTAWPLNSLITVDSFGSYIYSHFGSRDPMSPLLTIKVTL